jgi:hypothetical protein
MAVRKPAQLSPAIKMLSVLWLDDLLLVKRVMLSGPMSPAIAIVREFSSVQMWSSNDEESPMVFIFIILVQGHQR